MPAESAARAGLAREACRVVTAASRRASAGTSGSPRVRCTGTAVPSVKIEEVELREGANGNSRLNRSNGPITADNPFRVFVELHKNHAHRWYLAKVILGVLLALGVVQLADKIPPLLDFVPRLLLRSG